MPPQPKRSALPLAPATPAADTPVTAKGAEARVKRLPPLNWLRAFEATARTLSFTAAAAELHITQSAVSQQIKALEVSLGRPLFVRRVRGLTLTEDAMSYLPTVQAAFALLAQGTRELTGRKQPNVLHLQANLSFTVYWLTPRLERFLASHPSAQLNITTSIWSQEKHHQTPSLEIFFGTERSHEQVGKRLTQEHLFPVCSPALAKKIKTLDDLLGQRLLDLPGTLESWDAYLASYPGQPNAITPPVHRVSTWAVSLQWAQAGLGVALAHGTIANDLIASGQLVRPLAHQMPMSEAYYLVAPEGLPKGSAALAFKQWLLRELPEVG
jgi:LysR family glycine cleavage system transcriptional activator